MFGQPYQYSSRDAILGGLGGKSLEIVARYSYTGLNDIKDGELYIPGREQYYTEGVLQDYPVSSLSVGGGNVHAFTIGANYAFNRFAQVMVEYSHKTLSRDKYEFDKKFNTVQARVMFSF